MTNKRKGIDRGTGPAGAKSFNGKLYSLWSFHKLKKIAQKEAKLLRSQNWARVIKYKYPSGRFVWAVYARRRGMGGF